jgi:hypothetical protein
MPKSPTATEHLSCRRCRQIGLLSTVRVERGVQRRKYHGKFRDCVDVTCSNGHEWWSVSREAIRRSRKRDARANLKLQAEEA